MAEIEKRKTYKELDAECRKLLEEYKKENKRALAIFQLEEHECMFMPYEYWFKKKIHPKESDYCMTYIECLENMDYLGGLDDIYERFNLPSRPNANTSHALTMSDVIAYYDNDGEVSFWFVDFIGFIDITHEFR